MLWNVIRYFLKPGTSDWQAVLRPVTNSLAPFPYTMVFDAAMTSILQNRIDTSGDFRALGAIYKDPHNLSFSHMMVSLNATYSNTSSSHVVASLQAAVVFATTPLVSDSDSSLDAFVRKLDMMEKDFTDTKYSISEILGFLRQITVGIRK